MQMLEQGSTEWLDVRRNGIGGSDAGIIMGITPKKWGTKYKLYLEKLGLGAARTQNAAMKRGVDLEPVAREAFVKATGIAMTPKMMWHETHPFMFASLDGISECGKYILEVKCAGRDDHAEAINGRIPYKYTAQVQHYLAVTNAECCFYWSFDGRDGVLVKVQRDDLFIVRMIEEERKFWECVESFSAPEMEDDDYELKDGDEWQNAISLYLALDDEIKAKTKDLEKIRAFIISLCGSSSSRGAGIKVRKSITRAPINYKKIPELNGVDLEKYRGDPKEMWTITREKVGE